MSEAGRDETGDVGRDETRDLPPLEDVPSQVVSMDNTRPKRALKSTEKGKQFQLNNIKTFMKNVYRRLSRQTTLLDTLLESNNIDLVNIEATNLDRINTELSDAYTRVGMLFEEEMDSDTSEEYTGLVIMMDEVDSRYFATKQKICTWLIQQEKNAVVLDHVRSEKSYNSERSNMSKKSKKSHTSRRSQASSKGSNRSDLSVMQKAKIEGLKAEVVAMKKTKEAELAAELMRLEQKIKKAEAMEKVFSQPLNENDEKRSVRSVRNKHSNLMPKPSTPELQIAMMEMMKLQCAPKPDLDVFSGDPLEYFYFKASFKDVVEATVTDQRGRLTRLIKYTNGDAKELIKHLVHGDPKDCYDQAMLLLDKEYGNPHLISCLYIKELRQWKSVRQHDSAAYKKLYRFLLKCQAYKRQGRLQELDTTDIIRTVISKMHTTQQERWNRKAVDIRRKQGREAVFSDLVKFMEMEVVLMCDPAYSRDALLDVNNQVKSFSTQCNGEKLVSFKKCPLCNGEHDLEDCGEYLSKDIDQRYRTIFQQHLCFSCLEPVSSEHVSKTCNKKRKCRVCNESHPTTLHNGKVAKFVNHTTLENSVISMCVVPVQLWHKDHSDQRVIVYALLDECSQATFIREDVLEILDVPNKRHTSISVKTLNGEREDQAVAVDGLVVECAASHSASYPSSRIELPCTYSRTTLAIDVEEIPTPSKISSWDYLQVLMDKLPDYDATIPIALMIGGNCPPALEPVEVIPSISNGPYARRSRLGWCIIGPIGTDRSCDNVHSYATRTIIPVEDVSTGSVATHYFCTKNSFQDTFAINLLKEMYVNDFNETASEKKALSVEDERFIDIMEKGVCKRNKHYELPLPFRDENICLPNNRIQALKRLSSVKRKLIKDEQSYAEYVSSMASLISKGYARKADTSTDNSGRVWYIPHHGVFNTQKGKLRVVFDCSVRYKDRCLNNELIQGPEMTNLLVGVLVRFRKEPVAFMADIEAMFHQVFVPESQCGFLRFLWWPDGQLDKDPEDYEMCVHTFGAVSSGSCANFALRRTASDFKHQFGVEAAKTLCRDFYVDDLLKSTESVDEAKRLIAATRDMCAAGGFNLTKFLSNDRDVIDSIPLECRTSSVVDLDIAKTLPIERALGVFWCVENDTFNFRITMKDLPLTRRGILGTISSIYDPLGLGSPFILKGRKILQQITMENSSWDDDLSPDLRASWEKWRVGLPDLQELKIDRCYKPKNFTAVTSTLHSFSDASDYGYGTATYSRQVNDEGEVCVSLVMGKSRVVPSKQTTVPRLELNAAVVSAKVTAMLIEELDMGICSATYWIDSMIVLGYIQNDVKRFRTYVANRTKKIRNQTEKNQWMYISTDDNPADDASRGISVNDKEKVKRWFYGPSFLWDKNEPSRLKKVQVDVPDDDPEVQVCTKSNVSKIVNKERSILGILEVRISNWMRQRRVLATVLLFLEKCRKKRLTNGSITVADVRESENLIIKMIQENHFGDDIAPLKSANRQLNKSSQLIRLDPYLDDAGILRVGGRLSKSSFPEEIKHPVILPKRNVVVTRIIEWHHRNIQHLGRTTTLNELRSQGYWIINGNAQVKSVIYRCVRCKLFRGQPCTQKMSELPESRMTSEPPFTYCGVDMFGPFLVKEARREVKRYGCIFTCFSCRAIHLETTISMDTDSFILALRRFIGRRGPVRSIRSDNGGNFIGADGEMQKALKEMDQDKIQQFLLECSCDWIQWERNPPISSHMGGVWERQIRSVRNVLSSLLKEHASRLNDESLRTLFVEVEAIVNSRPLTVESLSDVTAMPLTPNHLLTMKSKVVLPPPGVFQKADVYCRKRWRTVQYLANMFWECWRKEYLSIQQGRQKWSSVQRNFKVNDIVLIKDEDANRNQWPMGRVIEVFPSDDGLVRKVSLKVSGSELPLLRPITKLVLLAEGDAKD